MPRRMYNDGCMTTRKGTGIAAELRGPGGCKVDHLGEAIFHSDEPS